MTNTMTFIIIMLSLFVAFALFIIAVLSAYRHITNHITDNHLWNRKRPLLRYGWKILLTPWKLFQVKD